MKFGTRWLTLAALCLLAHILSAAAQEKSTWDTIKETGVVRMGCINAEPWGFKDPKDGTWHGIGPGFNKLIAEELKVKAECVETTWGTAIAGLQAGQFDLVAGFDPTPQRALAIDFPQGALIYYAVAILVRPDLKVDTWEDLNKPEIRIVVPLGTSNDLAMTRMLPKATFERTKDAPLAIASFASGRADLVGGSSLWVMMQNVAIGNKGRVIIPKPAQAANAALGVRKEADKRWRDWLSVALDYYYWRGTMGDVVAEFAKYRGIDPKEVPPIRIEDMR
jgi:polar amino acid transport system substrate-binding protein